MKPTRVLYVGILLLLALLAFLLAVSHVAAANRTIGSMPYPTAWNRQYLEIRWPLVPDGAQDYQCIFWINDGQGFGFVGSTDTWLDYGDSVYTRMYWDFGGNKWLLKDLYCVAQFVNGSEVSPDNPNTYYVDLISKIVLTLITVKQ